MGATLRRRDAALFAAFAVGATIAEAAAAAGCSRRTACRHKAAMRERIEAVQGAARAAALEGALAAVAVVTAAAGRGLAFPISAVAPRAPSLITAGRASA